MFDAPKAKLQITINKHKAIDLHWKTSFRYAFIYDYYFKIFAYGLSDVLIKVIYVLFRQTQPVENLFISKPTER
jgi:hypothetical protein